MVSNRDERLHTVIVSSYITYITYICSYSEIKQVLPHYWLVTVGSMVSSPMVKPHGEPPDAATTTWRSAFRWLQVWLDLSIDEAAELKVCWCNEAGAAQVAAVAPFCCTCGKNSHRCWVYGKMKGKMMCGTWCLMILGLTIFGSNNVWINDLKCG